MSSELMIRVNDLSVGYREKGRARAVAAHITADVRRGELTCLLGTNGAGKSTLLRTLAAFQPPLAGTILVEGKELGRYTDKQLARLVSVVLTERCDIRDMSVAGLVGLGRSPYTGFWGRLDEEDRAVVARSLALVGIEELAGRLVHTLSDGERQKAMIAKALAQETPVILLDEPTAFLDFPSKVDMMQLLHRLSRQTGKTIFLSTHDLELALQMADKLWLMDPAGGVTVGSPEDLALDGSLGRFLVRKGIGFDEVTGLFRVEFACPGRIRVEGKEGRRMDMLRKALRRNGLEGDESARSHLRVRCHEDVIYLYSGKHAVAVSSNIGFVMSVLRRELKTLAEQQAEEGQSPTTA